MPELPFRQVHLDFHTSPLIEDICEEFDAHEFVRVLKSAHVNSITVFAKCHHGMSYYNTKVGVKHPHLKIDLLGEMVEACKKEGIRIVAYISVGWDNYIGERHPEWLQCDRDGRLMRPRPYEPGWYLLCMNTPYVDYVEKQTREVLEMYDIDGIFFDIVFQIRPGCLCYYCRKSMEEKGLDMAREEDLNKHSFMIERSFMQRMSKLVKEMKPGATVYFNSRTLHDLGVNLRREADYYTHFEIESLPTAFWGYWHFPFYVRFLRTLGKPIVGMTARFHKSWGDFGGLKTRDQLAFECATMLANCAMCSIGDQMHPRGKLEEAVYEVIGEVYREVEAKEPWCKGAIPVTEVALLLRRRGDEYKFFRDTEYGAIKMLLELKHQFDVVDQEADFSKYRLIIVPDEGEVSDECADKLKVFLAKGGSVIFSYTASLEGDEFKIPSSGIEYVGPSKFHPEYLEPMPPVSEGLPSYRFVMYERGLYVKPGRGAEVLAKLYRPYFNRTYKTFTSHRQAPVDKEMGYPAIVRNGNVIYVNFPIFRAYFVHGYYVYKKLIDNCIELLMPQRLIRTNAPPSSEVTVTKQGSRLIVHVVNFQPCRRGGSMEYVEQAHPIKDVRIKLRTDEEPKRVYLAPQMKDLPYEYKAPYTEVVIPSIRIHQMAVFDLS